MPFFVTDPKGNQVPFIEGMDWRHIPPSNDIQEARSAGKELNQSQPQREWPHGREGTSQAVESERPPHRLYRGSTPILAGQIMSRPVKVLHVESLLHEAWDLVKDNRFRHLPILKDGVVVGLVSDRELLRQLQYIEGRHENVSQDLFVRDVMVTRVMCARPETEISHIAKVFIQERIGAMPILQTEGALVGIVTRSDILKTIVSVSTYQYRG